MIHSSLKLSSKDVLSELDPRLYSSFLEHLGRAIYEGIYEPDHPTADEDGFRQDVIDMVRSLKLPLVRYPGGNFVSGYNWEDGIGPKELRPKRLELAWMTIEDNQVGVDDFATWCKKVGTSPMMAVNLGTRGPDEARKLVEYCNHPNGTALSDLRVKNGYPEPHNIKTWCLGNEMDGPWQIGAKTAYEYARTANEAAKLMKWVDPSIELVACGSSGKGMPTYKDWERTVAEECYDHIDYVSLHTYYGNRDDDTPSFLARSVEMGTFIEEVCQVLDEVRDRLHKDKTLNLSFDEWNVWYHSNESDKEIPRWTRAPHQLEDVYNFEDALLVGLMLITLINHADRVKIACMAQLVNVIAPIMTEKGGSVWQQSIFYPLLHASNYGRGKVLRAQKEGDTYDCAILKEVPYVDYACVQNDEETLTVFAVNRSLEEDAQIQIQTDFTALEPLIRMEYQCEDLKAVNTAAAQPLRPHAVFEGSFNGGNAAFTLKKQSWNMIRLKVK